MDARLRKIQITPMKFDKEGAMQREEFATAHHRSPHG